jgi:hypothetical protein
MVLPPTPRLVSSPIWRREHAHRSRMVYPDGQSPGSRSGGGTRLWASPPMAHVQKDWVNREFIQQIQYNIMKITGACSRGAGGGEQCRQRGGHALALYGPLTRAPV